MSLESVCSLQETFCLSLKAVIPGENPQKADVKEVKLKLERIRQCQGMLFLFCVHSLKKVVYFAVVNVLPLETQTQVTPHK